MKASKITGKGLPEIKFDKRKAREDCVTGVNSFLDKVSKMKISCDPIVSIPSSKIAEAIDTCLIEPSDQSRSAEISSEFTTLACHASSAVKFFTDPRLEECFEERDTTIELGKELKPMLEKILNFTEVVFDKLL